MSHSTQIISDTSDVMSTCYLTGYGNNKPHTNQHRHKEKATIMPNKSKLTLV